MTELFISNLDQEFIKQTITIIFGAVPVGVLLSFVPYLAGYLIRKTIGWITNA